MDNPHAIAALETVIERLKTAREHAIIAHAPNTLTKIRSAIKSAEGAVRHAYRAAGDPTMKRRQLPACNCHEARDLAAVRAVLVDPAGEWRELNSCADAIQDISGIVGTTPRTAADGDDATGYALIEEEHGSEFPWIILGVYPTRHEANEAADARREAIKTERPNKTVDNDDEDGDDNGPADIFLLVEPVAVYR